MQTSRHTYTWTIFQCATMNGPSNEQMSKHVTIFNGQNRQNDQFMSFPFENPFLLWLKPNRAREMVAYFLSLYVPFAYYASARIYIIFNMNADFYDSFYIFLLEIFTIYNFLHMRKLYSWNVLGVYLCNCDETRNGKHQNTIYTV